MFSDNLYTREKGEMPTNSKNLTSVIFSAGLTVLKQGRRLTVSIFKEATTWADPEGSRGRGRGS